MPKLPTGYATRFLCDVDLWAFLPAIPDDLERAREICSDAFDVVHGFSYERGSDGDAGPEWLRPFYELQLLAEFSAPKHREQFYGPVMRLVPELAAARGAPAELNGRRASSLAHLAMELMADMVDTLAARGGGACVAVKAAAPASAFAWERDKGFGFPELAQVLDAVSRGRPMPEGLPDQAAEVFAKLNAGEGRRELREYRKAQKAAARREKPWTPARWAVIHAADFAAIEAGLDFEFFRAAHLRGVIGVPAIATDPAPASRERKAMERVARLIAYRNARPDCTKDEAARAAGFSRRRFYDNPVLRRAWEGEVSDRRD